MLPILVVTISNLTFNISRSFPVFMVMLVFFTLITVRYLFFLVKIVSRINALKRG